jgi:hypothetical protein
MKYLIAVLASILSVWMFYFLWSPRSLFRLCPFCGPRLAGKSGSFPSRINAAHVIFPTVFLLAIENDGGSIGGFLHHALPATRIFWNHSKERGKNPALIQYLISSGWDNTQQLILTSLGFTLIFAIFAVLHFAGVDLLFM